MFNILTKIRNNKWFRFWFLGEDCGICIYCLYQLHGAGMYPQCTNKNSAYYKQWVGINKRRKCEEFDGGKRVWE